MSPDEAVAQLARTPRLLVALDFDGTLSPLVDEPMSARMLPEARTAVEALQSAPSTTVALVSGRTLRDLRIIAEHGDASPVRLAGSHGAEQWPAGPGSDGTSDADRALADDVRAEAESIAAAEDGAWIEAKEFGFALHTRLLPASRLAGLSERIDALMASRASGWRRRAGHDILEFSFRHDGKDGAVAWLRAAVDATAVLFAGDDVTDEDALRSLGPHDVGVRVGPGETAAAVRVDGIPELAAMLVLLAHERTAGRE